GKIRVGKDLCEVLWNEPGRFAARRPGEYDKKNDVRRPDRFVIVEAATGKVTLEQEITDPIGLARVTKLHEGHTGLWTFAHMSPDTKWLRVVDGGTEWDLPAARPLAKYDAQTVQFQRLDEKHLLFSITVDPVNREAVERKKTDRDDVDFYVAD